MKELTCPNCNTFITITENSHNKNIICKKCLETLDKSFIMIESSEETIYNKGDGFFTKEL